MHGFGWSWRIVPRNSRRFGFRSVYGGVGGGCYGSRLRDEALPRVSPVPASHPVAKFERLWCAFVWKGSELGVVFSRDFGGSL